MADSPDKARFQEAVELIRKRVQDAYQSQDSDVAIQPNPQTFEIKGWLWQAQGTVTWWPYQVDPDRLRNEGPAAIAQDFFEGYAPAREAHRGPCATVAFRPGSRFSMTASTRSSIAERLGGKQWAASPLATR